jgi:tetratricopeptide (TPR) repeat protein
MAHYQRALDIKPDYAEAHRNLANTLLAFDRNEEPIAHYERSLATKPAAAGSTTRRRPSHPRAVRGRSPQQARPTRRVLAPVRPRAGQTGVGVIGQKGPPEAQRARTTKQYNCFHNPIGHLLSAEIAIGPGQATHRGHRSDRLSTGSRGDFRPFWISGSDAFRPPHS